MKTADKKQQTGNMIAILISLLILTMITLWAFIFN